MEQTEPKTETSDTVNKNTSSSSNVTTVKKDDSESIFQCSTCVFRTNYDYFGRNPSQVKNYILLEDSFVLNDPFSTPREGKIIILGALCIKCQKIVCKNTNCSVYYEGTYCISCAKFNSKRFPNALQEKINRIV